MDHDFHPTKEFPRSKRSKLSVMRLVMQLMLSAPINRSQNAAKERSNPQWIMDGIWIDGSVSRRGCLTTKEVRQRPRASPMGNEMT
jgi:hypothetical protein